MSVIIFPVYLSISLPLSLRQVVSHFCCESHANGKETAKSLMICCGQSSFKQTLLMGMSCKWQAILIFFLSHVSPLIFHPWSGEMKEMVLVVGGTSISPIFHSLLLFSNWERENERGISCQDIMVSCWNLLIDYTPHQRSILLRLFSLSIKVIFRHVVLNISLCLNGREKESLPVLKPPYGDAVEL